MRASVRSAELPTSASSSAPPTAASRSAPGALKAAPAPTPSANPGAPLPDTAYVEGKGAHRSGFFTAAWLPFSVATVLRAEPTNQLARAIWTQLVADASAQPQILTWFPPVPQ